MELVKFIFGVSDRRNKVIQSDFDLLCYFDFFFKVNFTSVLFSQVRVRISKQNVCDLISKKKNFNSKLLCVITAIIEITCMFQILQWRRRKDYVRGRGKTTSGHCFRFQYL